MIRVALAEDNVFLAKSVQDILNDDERIELKFWATNGLDLLEKLQQNSMIDVIIMDIEMPQMNGIDATKEICSKYPQIKVLMSTVFDDDDNLFNAIQAGASGYLLKDESGVTLVKSIQDVLEGGAPMSPSVASKTLKLLRAQPISIEPAKNYNLTNRETEILEQLCQGLSYNRIAENLIISPKTVRKHIENVYFKLNVHSKMEALKVAQKNRLI